MNVYKSTIESRVLVFNSIPDKDSVVADRNFTSGMLIQELEILIKSALRCSRSRAFLVSDFVKVSFILYLLYTGFVLCHVEWCIRYLR